MDFLREILVKDRKARQTLELVLQLQHSYNLLYQVEIDLPSKPTKEDLEQIQKYLSHHLALEEKSNSIYQDKEQILGSKLIIFKHKKKNQQNYYYRMYVGDRK